MRLHRFIPCWGVAALAALVMKTGAQEPAAALDSAPRSLEALVAEALEKNPELEFYQAEIAAARAGRRSAGQLPNPELSASAGHKTARVGGLGDEGLAWSVSVAQPFEWPGRLSLRKSIANHDIELAELGLKRFKAALAARARALAYALFAAQEKHAAAAEVAERFSALRETLVQRDPAGLTPLLETRVIEATELNAQRKAAESELASQSALLELNQLRGAGAGAPLAAESPRLEFRPLPDTGTLLALVHTNNFELKARATELAQQGLRADLARNERFPAIRVGPSISEERAGGESERIIGLSMSVPLPLWNRNKGAIGAAKARQTQAEVAMAVAERDLQRQTLDAARAYETRLREMAKWRPDSAAHFKEAAELADRHYRLGAVPIATYVELQKQYLDAVEGLLDTRKEALEAAARLELLAGLPEPLVRAGEVGP